VYGFSLYRTVDRTFFREGTPIKLPSADREPTRSKTAISAALKEGNFVSTRFWRSVAVQLPGGSSERFRTQLLNDAQGKLGRQMEPEWAETGLEPGFEAWLGRRRRGMSGLGR